MTGIKRTHPEITEMVFLKTLMDYIFDWIKYGKFKIYLQRISFYSKCLKTWRRDRSPQS